MHEKKKKALILCEVFYPEEFLINDLVDEWVKAGCDFEVLTRVPSYPFGKVYEGYKNKICKMTLFDSINVHRVPIMQGYQKKTLIKLLNYFYFVFWSCLIILFIGRRFNKVFIYQTGPLTLATAGIWAKKLFGAKVVLWIQDLWPNSVYAYGFKKTKFLTFCLNHFVRWVYKNCDEILVSCEGFTDIIKQLVPSSKPIFTPNWSLVEYNPANKITLPGKYNFTFAGNVGTVQNLNNVLRGFNIFARNHLNAWLNIIGDGSYLSELKTLVEREKIPNVNFTGRQPLSSISDYYEASDVLVLSLKDVPLYEIMIPSKFQAYLTTGKPIYAIFKGEVKNIVDNNIIGLTANPNNIEDIARGFEHFIQLSDEEYKIMSNNAIYLSNCTYNREKIITQINSIFWK